ncbi:hypothetical protein [Sphingomonas colocasiae]|uniref:Uncharacterized protein n=1 Tax=Sphingomonas colocasiae TaxID=1848973 RepID=A0ABS7PT68_9SPHN|nr:hypothetical protein [Sphingomonas colocasiae]MBY8824179.1 hypothetical protein [Sphingomonas colocasiae]
MNGVSDGFNEALNQTGMGGFPLIQVFTGAMLTFAGAFRAQARPNLRLESAALH